MSPDPEDRKPQLPRISEVGRTVSFVLEIYDCVCFFYDTANPVEDAIFAVYENIVFCQLLGRTLVCAVVTYR